MRLTIAVIVGTWAFASSVMLLAIVSVLVCASL
jgi:hypothetical protein